MNIPEMESTISISQITEGEIGDKSIEFEVLERNHFMSSNETPTTKLRISDGAGAEIILMSYGTLAKQHFQRFETGRFYRIKGPINASPRNASYLHVDASCTSSCQLWVKDIEIQDIDGLRGNVCTTVRTRVATGGRQGAIARRGNARRANARLRRTGPGPRAGSTGENIRVLKLQYLGKGLDYIFQV